MVKIPISSIYEVSRLFGVDPRYIVDKGPDKIGGHEYHMRCPFPGCSSRHDALSVSNGLYHCRKCHASGTVAQLKQERGEDISAWEDPERMRRIAEAEERERRRRRERYVAARKSFDGIVSYAASAIKLAHIQEIAGKWGITEETVRRVKIGFAMRRTKVADDVVESLPGLTLPYYDVDGRIVDIEWRLLPSIQKDYPHIRYRPFISTGVRAIGYMKGETNTYILVEGSMKAYKLWQHGFSVIWVPGINSVNPDFARNIGDVVVTYDEPRYNIIKAAIDAAHVFQIEGNSIAIAAPLHDGGKKIDDILNGKTASSIREWLHSMTVSVPPQSNEVDVLTTLIHLREKYIQRARPMSQRLAAETGDEIIARINKLSTKTQQL